MKREKNMVVGITGASGFVYGVCLLKMLQTLPWQSHLVMTKAAQLTRHAETDFTLDQIHALADVVYSVNDLQAGIASGSFPVDGMIIAPCSMHTLAEVATGVTSNLLTRAADVTLKQRRRLVLLARETPLHSGHLKNMLTLSQMGGVIMPPVPEFYTRPQTVDDIVTQTVARALDLFDIEVEVLKRWQGK